MSYQIIGRNSINPNLLNTKISIPENIDSVLIVNGQIRKCGNDETDYYYLNLEQKYFFIKNKLKANHLININVNTSLGQDSYCKYKIWSEENSYLYFTNDVYEKLVVDKETQYLRTRYIWVLLNWFEFDIYYKRWKK